MRYSARTQNALLAGKASAEQKIVRYKHKDHSMKPSFQKGQPVSNTCNGQSGLVIGVFFNEFSGQHVYNVRVPGISGFCSWNELCTVAAVSADALVAGDMVIALDHDGARHMGQVVGKTLDGCLTVKFAIGTYAVSLNRVWRAWPTAQNMARAS
jgi:hypothetical protein